MAVRRPAMGRMRRISPRGCGLKEGDGECVAGGGGWICEGGLVLVLGFDYGLDDRLYMVGCGLTGSGFGVGSKLVLGIGSMVKPIGHGYGS